MVLFCFVRLKNSDEKFVVKTTWCEDMNTARVQTYGNKPNKQRRIFFSPNEFEEPDFSMEISTTFWALNTACYMGYVINTFSELIKSQRIRIISREKYF